MIRRSRSRVETIPDYSGPFDPAFRLGHLSREALARLGREYMMVGHLHDRVLMPILAARFGPEAMTGVAIDEWMGSSPIYNERNRALLRIEGDGVSSILKGLQLDVGAPHQYMDFRFELVDETRGFFWLEYCGAYDDVSRAAGGRTEPIIQMCHHMEDPTFDATAMAVNPYARCRPVHRPPLQIGHVGPVCRWEVAITDEHGTVEERAITRTMRGTKAARFAFPSAGPPGTGGLDDYGGPFRADFALEDLSQPALVTQCKEFALDVHLLIRASHLSIRERWGDDARAEIARAHWAGAAPIYVERIRRALRMEGDDIAACLKMLQVDPAFPHDYVAFGCERVDDRRGRFWIDECDALADDDPRGWLAVLDDAEAPGFDAVVTAVNPCARVRPVDPAALASARPKPARAWELEIDEESEPRRESPWAKVARISTVAAFELRSRPPARR
jgi:hypothetical protein